MRTFTSSPSQSQEPAPSQHEISEMQKHLRRGIGGKAQPKQTSARESIAERIRKSAPQTAETYHAYGATEHFLNSIDEIVGYDIPQVKMKEEVPKLEGGEEIGVATGNGEWYRGTWSTHSANVSILRRQNH